METETLSKCIVNTVRGCTRPILVVFGLVSWVMLFANYFDIPGYFTGWVGGMILWWFRDRSYFKKKKVDKGEN